MIWVFLAGIVVGAYGVVVSRDAFTRAVCLITFFVSTVGFWASFIGA